MGGAAVDRCSQPWLRPFLHVAPGILLYSFLFLLLILALVYFFQ